MGADPATMALMASILGSSILGGLMAPEGQELESFSRQGGDIDPRSMLRDARSGVLNVSEHATDRLNDPLLLETRVPSLPAFVGGGLPFAIAAPAQDQAYVNPAVAVSPGRAMRRPLPAGQETRGGTDPSVPQPPQNGGDIPYNPDNPESPKPPYRNPNATVTRRPLGPDGVRNLGEGDPDDVSRAMGAAQMLMQLSKPRTGAAA